MSSVVIAAIKFVSKGSLRAFVSVQITPTMTIHEVVVMSTNGNLWAAPPSKPVVINGHHAGDNRGKLRYIPIIEFSTKEARDRFSSVVIEAILAAYGPDCLNGGAQ